MDVRKVIDHEYLIDWAIENGVPEGEARRANKKFLFGYEAWDNGEHLGTAFAMLRYGQYTLDGYNRTDSFFGACILAGYVIKELFENYTNEIFTYHDIEKKSVTALAMRLGFKKMYESEGQIVLMLRKQDGNGH